MPDLNKLAALEAKGFKIVASCGLCQHASFGNTDWGTCSLITYQHLKHKGIREASIHKAGCCPQYQIKPQKMEDLDYSGFSKFIS